MGFVKKENIISLKYSNNMTQTYYSIYFNNDDLKLLLDKKY